MRHQYKMRFLTILFVVITMAMVVTDAVDPERVIFMQPGQKYNVVAPVRVRKIGENVRIYCYRGGELSWFNAFERIRLNIKIQNDRYTLYKGNSAAKVMERYEKNLPYSRKTVPEWQTNNYVMHPFKESCLGMETLQRYEVEMQASYEDTWQMMKMLFGVMLILFAQEISQAEALYNVISSFGICGLLTPIVKACMSADCTTDVVQILWAMYSAHYKWYCLFMVFSAVKPCYNWKFTKNRIQVLANSLLKMFALGLLYYVSYNQKSLVLYTFLTVIVFNGIKAAARALRADIEKRFGAKEKAYVKNDVKEQRKIDLKDELHVRGEGSEPDENYQTAVDSPCIDEEHDNNEEEMYDTIGIIANPSTECIKKVKRLRKKKQRSK